MVTFLQSIFCHVFIFFVHLLFFSPKELGENEAKQALLEYVTSHYCYGSSAAKRLNVTKIVHSSAFHVSFDLNLLGTINCFDFAFFKYTLETFTESRQLCWAYEPYLGEHVEGPICNDPPNPWDVYLESPDSFENHSVTITLPNTECVRSCHSCEGTGKDRCHGCQGTGFVSDRRALDWLMY